MNREKCLCSTQTFLRTKHIIVNTDLPGLFQWKVTRIWLFKLTGNNIFDTSFHYVAGLKLTS